jgi:hypothetical protein
MRLIRFVDHAVWQQVTGNETPKNRLSLERPAPDQAQNRKDRKGEKSIKKPLEEVKTIVPRNR